MPNSIRTPKLGTTATHRRVAQAVDDEHWQKFRVSLKGEPTAQKLWKLKDYFERNFKTSKDHTSEEWQDVCIRVVNYLQALARGGQIQSTGDYLHDLIKDRLVIRK